MLFGAKLTGILEAGGEIASLSFPVEGADRNPPAGRGGAGDWSQREGYLSDAP